MPARRLKRGGERLSVVLVVDGPLRDDDHGLGRVQPFGGGEVARDRPPVRAQRADERTLRRQVRARVLEPGAPLRKYVAETSVGISKTSCGWASGATPWRVSTRCMSPRPGYTVARHHGVDHSVTELADRRARRLRPKKSAGVARVAHERRPPIAYTGTPRRSSTSAVAYSPSSAISASTGSAACSSSRVAEMRLAVGEAVLVSNAISFGARQLRALGKQLGNGIARGPRGPARTDRRRCRASRSGRTGGAAFPPHVVPSSRAARRCR